jgi:Skp family chaperone for outer membrane proteins
LRVRARSGYRAIEGRASGRCAASRPCGAVADRKAIAADRQALAAEQAKLSQSDRQAREAGLAAREVQLAQKIDADNKRLAAARDTAIGQIRSAMRPALVSAYQAHKCGLLLDRAAVIGGNMTHDLTAPVLATLDERLPTLSPAIAPVP